MAALSHLTIAKKDDFIIPWKSFQAWVSKVAQAVFVKVSNVLEFPYTGLKALFTGQRRDTGEYSESTRQKTGRSHLCAVV